MTVPLTTLLGLADSPGESAGYGPLDASTARLLAPALTGHLDHAGAAWPWRPTTLPSRHPT